MSGCLEPGELPGRIGRLRLDGDPDEESVVAVGVGVTERLAFDRKDSPSLLAGRLRDQLLEPHAESIYGRRDGERQLVAAFESERPDRGAERGAGVLLGRGGPAGLR